MSDHRDIQTQIDELSRRQRRLTRMLAGLFIGVALFGLLGAAQVFDEDVTVRGALTTSELAVSREAQFDSKIRAKRDLTVDGDLKVSGRVEFRDQRASRFVILGEVTHNLEKKIESLADSLDDLERAVEKHGVGLGTVEKTIRTLDDTVSDLERDIRDLKQKVK